MHYTKINEIIYIYNVPDIRVLTKKKKKTIKGH